MTSPKKMKAKHRHFLGGFVPAPLATAVDTWVDKDPERDRSVFLRQAAREKLQREGITFDDQASASNI
jgi:metal-responsive CopG/Arc/MetJ family transcriptional regulator